MKLYFSRNLMVSCKWYLLPILFLFTCFFTFKSNAQNPINYVEYYMDQDPGIGKANAVSITSGVNVTNASFNIDVTNIKTGIHIVGSRARTSAGVWGMTHNWFVFKPFPAITPSNIDNIVKVEYYVDNDPGFGKGTAATITAGTNLQNIVFNINPSAYSKGTHMIGVRALTSANIWSHTNYWLFYNSFDVTPPPSALSNINYVEYYVNTDPGFGKGIPVTITSSTDISNTAFNAAIDTVKSGTSMIGVRAKSANGAWSYTNYLLFVKPFAITPAPAAPGNITSVEYFLDYDPGIGNATPVSITAATNLADLSFNVDLTNIIPGNHFVSVRARDANGKWSLVNSWPFSIPGTVPNFTTTFTPTNICVGDSIQVGYSAKGIIFNTKNKFLVQLSDENATTFNNPTNLGEIVSTKDTDLIKVFVPANLAGKSYRIRVVSTSQSIIGTSNASSFVINALPTAPVISPSKDTAICTGKTITLSSNIGGTLEWLLNRNIIANETTSSYTANAAGRYNVRFINSVGCKSDTSKGISISLTALPPVPTISSNKNTSFCVGDSVVLTSSAITGNQWFLNGAAITASVQNSITVKASGVYSVSVVNGSGCISSSINTTVTANAFPSTPVISNNRPLSFLAGDSTILSSSSPTGNQWLLNGVNIAGATGASITVKAAGNYTVIVSNATGCSTTSATTVVTINAAAIIPVISNNRPLSFCTGDSTVLTSSIATGNQWYLNGAVISGSTSSTYTAKTSGSYTVINNAQTSVAVVVTANSLPATPVISNSRPLTFSNGDSTILTSSSGTGNQWLLNGSNITGATATSIIVKAAGVYGVKVTNGSGCTATSITVTVTVNAATAIPVISNSRPLSFCVGDSTVLTSSIASGNQWYLNGTAISGSTSATYTAKTSGSYTVANNAQISVALVVTANSLPATPVITNSRPLTFNTGDSTILTSSLGTGNQWLLNGSNIAGATATTITVKTAGSYSVKVTNGSGCTAISTTVTVTVNGAIAIPVISNNRPLSFCVGDSTVLTSSIATGNQWYLNGTAISGSTGATYTAKTSGSYTVMNNAQLSTGVIVTANAIPTKPTISRDVNNNLVSSSNSGNQWYNDTNTVVVGGTQQLFKPLSAGYYSVKVSQNGCSSIFSDKYYYLVTALPILATSTEIKLYPNPANNYLILSHKLPGVTNLNIDIVDINGKKLLMKKALRSGDQIDISNLQSGVYYMKCTNGSLKQEYVLKFVKL